MIGAFAEGIARMLAGEPGTPQDHSQATYAAQFTEEEHWLDWTESKDAIQCKAAALNLFGRPEAKAKIDGVPYVIARVESLPDGGASATPGTVLERTDDSVIIAVADGALCVKATPLAT